MACNITILAPDATAVVKDTIGTVLATRNIPSGVSEDIVVEGGGVCADATAVLNNTLGTELSSTPIASGASATIVAPDATAVVKDTSGNILATESIPSNVSEDIVVSTGPSPLYAYNYGSLNTGQDVSYAIGDDKWVRDEVFNPEIASWPTDRPFVFPLLSSNPLLLSRGATPAGTNIFGNLNRFTDENGLQIYGNNYLIDHFLGLGFSAMSPSIATNWEQQITEINALTKSGFSDWYMPNLRILIMSQFYNDSNPNEYIISIVASGSSSINQFSSTTRSNLSTQLMTHQSLLRVNFANKTSVNSNQLIIRKAFTYDPLQDTTKLILS